MKVDKDKNKVLFKGKNYYNFFYLFASLQFIITIIQVIFINVEWLFLYLIIFPGLPILYFVTSKIYFKFYLFNEFILIRHSFKWKKREEIITLDRIKYIEFRNDLPGHCLVIIYPKRGIIKTNKWYPSDFFHDNVFVFLRLMYSKGIEIDISRCADKEGVMREIRIKK